MINDELLNKFGRIEDLPVPEEMLGAYLEGNLDLLESSQIEFQISTDSYLSGLVDDVKLDDVLNQDFLEDSELELQPLFMAESVELPVFEDGNNLYCSLTDDYTDVSLIDDSVSTESSITEYSVNDSGYNDVPDNVCDNYSDIDMPLGDENVDLSN